MVASLAEALSLSDEARVITVGQPPHHIVHTNAAWSKVTGFKFTEVVNRSSSFLKGPATEAQSISELRTFLLRQRHVKVQVVNYDKEGNPFNNHLECFPLRNAHGVVTHFCGVLQRKPVEGRNIPKLDRGPNPLASAPIQMKTEVSQDEGSVKRKRWRLEDALHNTTDAVVMTQAHHPYAITHVNQPWCEMCGYTLEEVEGVSNKILQGPETDLSLVDDLMASVRRGEPGEATLVNYKKNGEKFVNQVKVMPVYNEQDEVEQFMAMLLEVDVSSDVAPAS
ncbi:hypothetical protein AB1Y20_007752 [Prymnesium parvum]|uniref:PAS domain-containing protein n=1 Tax=Prymnesium parvum TaxID=97485 RepID=A0AB34ISJ0_PRYPA|mmetsp:Transcript_25017/g.61985  ORF Transcript_25017/g.61985 Transcript_25017/m.61985 type:complete len:280 (+) Transcript_25017:158-997(+)|eukprot:CAMPEP_0182847680 /NCGR_PEP_ID=MMETSP0006_2-20121128/28586_1 /TAXON_ID=97485 /ORGANISM="Prymnesium parvum, Strain Texoma1" /LENGTH=279 /DNA_ID=CAMNT_0024978027 /DNA_START=114 /DNA_END=953 /DNA_ORIENTATION=+